MTEDTREQVVTKAGNPTGKGGFGDNPGNRNSGTWNKEDSIGYQYNKLIRMTVKEIKTWLQDNPDETRTLAQDMAYNAVLQARKDLAYLKEVTDRTEGKATQGIDHTSNGNTIVIPILGGVSNVQIDDGNSKTP